MDYFRQFSRQVSTLFPRSYRFLRIFILFFVQEDVDSGNGITQAGGEDGKADQSGLVGACQKISYACFGQDELGLTRIRLDFLPETPDMDL